MMLAKLASRPTMAIECPVFLPCLSHGEKRVAFVPLRSNGGTAVDSDTAFYPTQWR